MRRFDPRQLPVLVLGLVAAESQTDLADLRRLAERQIGPALEQLEGVAEVRVTGGREKQIQVRLDQARLDAYGLTINDVRNRISAANVDVNAGTVVEDDRVLLVRGLSRFTGPEDVAAAVVRYQDAGGEGVVPIYVSDLGEVVLADADITHVVRVDGVEGVGLSVYKEAGANTVAVSRVVRDAFAALAADLPGLNVTMVTDEAALVEDAIGELQSSALIGIALAIGVLFVFLRSPGPIFIVATAIPVSLLATVFAMSFAGYSLNLLTLGGLALGAGTLVDNAIVVMESIFRKRAAGEPPHVAAATGTGAVASAIVASTLTHCVVFLPVVLIEGMAARLVSGIAFTVVLSTLVSLVVAVLLIPALSVWLLPRDATRDVDPGQPAPRGVGVRHPRQAVDLARRHGSSRGGGRVRAAAARLGAAAAGRSAAVQHARRHAARAEGGVHGRDGGGHRDDPRGGRRRRPRSDALGSGPPAERRPADPRAADRGEHGRAQAAARGGRPERQRRRAKIPARGRGAVWRRGFVGGGQHRARARARHGRPARRRRDRGQFDRRAAARARSSCARVSRSGRSCGTCSRRSRTRRRSCGFR